MSSAPHREQGFTLMELLAVVAVIGLLGTLVFPSYQGFRRQMRLNGAVNEVKKRLTLAKTRALANPQVHCGVYFDFGSTPPAMLIFFDDNENYAFDNGSDRVYQDKTELPEEVTLTNSTANPVVNNLILFRGNGSARNGGRVKVANGVNSVSIDVLASTGRVKVIR